MDRRESLGSFFGLGSLGGVGDINIESYNDKERKKCKKHKDYVGCGLTIYLTKKDKKSKNEYIIANQKQEEYSFCMACLVEKMIKTGIPKNPN